MPAKLDRTNLKLRHSVYWLKLSIPRKVRHLFLSAHGKERAHVEENLRTKDIDEANRRKHGRIHHWLGEFDRRAKMAAGTLAPDIAEAFRLRDALRKADTSEEREVIREQAESRAREIAGEFGEHDDESPTLEQATEWFALATTTTPTLHEAFDAWMAQSEHTEGTRTKYRHAFAELLTFMERDDVRPAQVTRQVTLGYVDWLNANARSTRDNQPLSYATKKNRLVGLASFWTEYLEHRQLVPQGSNVWRGHKLTGKPKAQEGEESEKDAYTAEQIIALCKGPDLLDRENVRYTKRTLTQLLSLGLFTGARLNELCERRLGEVEQIRGGYMLHIPRSKTKAGIRDIPIYHSIPRAIIRERIGKRTDPTAQLFVEFTPGGPDNKLSWHAQKALGRYRDRVGIGERTDFHSTRRSFITRHEELETYELAVMRYVGHKPKGITFGLYAKKTEGTLDKVAKAITYSAPVERALRAALGVT